MTAFGRGQSPGEKEDFLAEIHCVNSKRLEIVVTLPGELTEFDPPLRKLIASVVSRGRISVFISCQPAYERGRAFRVDGAVARELKRAYDELRKLLGYSGEVDFSVIASHAEIVVPESPPRDAETRWEAIRSAVEAALCQLVAMKEAEGKNLRGAFDESLAELDKIVEGIEKAVPASLERHLDRLKSRVHEVASELPDNQERILREIVILADKLDVSEEIARLKSHIEQFRAIMNDDKPCGRTLDFLVQEMNREINTIGSKADDLVTSRMVVRAKADLEKIREQSQNIE
jgi:uncharacterized protein (TIGR00255 family)